MTSFKFREQASRIHVTRKTNQRRDCFRKRERELAGNSNSCNDSEKASGQSASCYNEGIGTTMLSLIARAAYSLPHPSAIEKYFLLCAMASVAHPETKKPPEIDRKHKDNMPPPKNFVKKAPSIQQANDFEKPDPMEVQKYLVKRASKAKLLQHATYLGKSASCL